MACHTSPLIAKKSEMPLPSLSPIRAIQNAYTSTMQVRQKWQLLESDAL